MNSIISSNSAASILIVDDQAANVRLLERLLADAGHTNVTSTMNPTEVVELHLANAYDLILLDLQMPDMDGFEVMARLRGITPTGYLPVIVLTAQPAHKLRALQAGARDFISKPFDLLEVKTRIANMLEVRLLYRQLEGYNELLEQTVRERTAELRESELRFRRLTELASDWYWEQNAIGDFTQISGPVFDMIGVGMAAFLGNKTDEDAGNDLSGWNEVERSLLQAKIAAREPFVDFLFSRSTGNGTRHLYRVSGEPMFNEACRFTGYRGIGVEIPEENAIAQAGGT